MKKKTSKALCGPGGNSGFGSSSTQILFKKVLEQEELLDLKREVHLNSQRWGYVSQSGKRAPNKKKKTKQNKEAETD